MEVEGMDVETGPTHEERQTIIDSVLSKQEESNKLRSILVNNSELIEVDLGNLLAVNENKPELGWRERKEEHFKRCTQDAVQVLFNSLWELPVDKTDGNYTVKLPDGQTWMPREKPVPKGKPLTKWEQFAKAKGILNKKKSRLVWDEASQSYKPRFGYNRANDNTKDWCIEVPVGADPYEDQFAKRKEAKRERIAKNELQRLRNIARTTKSKVPGVGITPTERPDKNQLSKALTLAHRSTASVGKFTENLPKEKRSKNMGKKRKFEPNIGNLNNERQSQLQTLNNLGNKTPIINVEKAANRQLRKEQTERAAEKRNMKAPKGKKGKGGNFSGKGGGKGGKGKGRKDKMLSMKGKTLGKKMKR